MMAGHDVDGAFADDDVTADVTAGEFNYQADKLRA
jgi:hypothetical protein